MSLKLAINSDQKGQKGIFTKCHGKMKKKKKHKVRHVIVKTHPSLAV